MPCFGYPGINLSRRQLASFTGLCSLCHLNLDFLGTHQVLAGNTETSGSYLLDSGTSIKAVFPNCKTLQAFTAFPAVGLTTQHIHGNGKGLMCFL